MAASFREAHRIPDGVDYTRSHRPPPLPPGSPQSAQHHAFKTVAESPRSAPQYHAYPHVPPARLPDPHKQQPLSPGRGAAQERVPFTSLSGGDEAAVADGDNILAQSPQIGRARGNSFSSIFKRSNSNASSHHTTHNAPYTTDESAPPLPNTRISQAHAEAAARKTQQQPKVVRKGSSSSFTMLRKSSKQKQQQQAEQARREASRVKEPPHLPSLNPLPGIATFGGEDARPDSVAIFNNAYTHSQPGATNFSRPGGAMSPSSTLASSSSPAYAVGGANGFPRDSTSPPHVSASRPTGEYVVTERTESMTNRGRYSYASSTTNINSVNSPRRVRRRKDPTPFNVLVIGAKNSGKSSFISFLRHSLALPSHKKVSDPGPEQQQVDGSRSSFTSHFFETEIDHERMGLTLWDSTGLEKNIVDLQMREVTAFVEAKFEDTFVEEQKVMRSPGVKDTHIHCVFLILDPVRLDSTIKASTTFKKHGSHMGSLDDDLDLQVMRSLWGKTTVIPVISKADTLTVNHMSFLKRAVWEALRAAQLDPLEALELEDDAEFDEEDEDALARAEEDDGNDSDVLPGPKARKSHKRQSSLSALAGVPSDDGEPPYIPMSILSPDIYDLPPHAPKSKAGKQDKVGRRFPWGFADPYDPNHCDFGRLRDSIFSEWRSELRELSRTKWYENWRTLRLKNLPGAKQRVKGGVTPVASVPQGGRMISQGTRQLSPQTAPSTTTLGAASSSVPRSVSAMSNTTAATSVGITNDKREVSGGKVRY